MRGIGWDLAVINNQEELDAIVEMTNCAENGLVRLISKEFLSMSMERKLSLLRGIYCISYAYKY